MPVRRSIRPAPGGAAGATPDAPARRLEDRWTLRRRLLGVVLFALGIWAVLLTVGGTARADAPTDPGSPSCAAPPCQADPPGRDVGHALDNPPDQGADHTPGYEPDYTPDPTPDYEPDRTPDHEPDRTPVHEPDRTPVHEPDQAPDYVPDHDADYDAEAPGHSAPPAAEPPVVDAAPPVTPVAPTAEAAAVPPATAAPAEGAVPAGTPADVVVPPADATLATTTAVTATGETPPVVETATAPAVTETVATPVARPEPSTVAGPTVACKQPGTSGGAASLRPSADADSDGVFPGARSTGSDGGTPEVTVAPASAPAPALPLAPPHMPVPLPMHVPPGSSAAAAAGSWASGSGPTDPHDDQHGVLVGAAPPIPALVAALAGRGFDGPVVGGADDPGVRPG